MEVTKEYVSSLLDKYGDMVLRISFTYLKNKDDAEDAVQEVFLKIISARPAFNDETHEKAWIIRTAINICKNKLTSYWNRKTCSISKADEAAVSDDTDITVLEAVMALPRKYRLAVYMHYYEGYSAVEIARITGGTDTGVRSILHRARKRLKAVLQEDYDFE